MSAGVRRIVRPMVKLGKYKKKMATGSTCCETANAYGRNRLKTGEKNRNNETVVGPGGAPAL